MKRNTLIKYSIFLMFTVVIIFSILFLERLHRDYTPPQETTVSSLPVVQPDADAIIYTKSPVNEALRTWDISINQNGFTVNGKNSLLINNTCFSASLSGFQYSLIQGDHGAFAFFYAKSCSEEENEALCRIILMYRKYFPVIVTGDISEKALALLMQFTSMNLTEHNGIPFLTSNVEALSIPKDHSILLRFLPCERTIDLNKKMIALTFDDGPHPINTPLVLAELKRYNASATFFVTGSNAEQHPEIVLDIFKDGNELGNHTNLHELFSENTPSIINKTIKETNDKIRKITGLPAFLLRPPGGSCYDRKSNPVSPGYPLILWKIDTLDYTDGRKSEDILKSVLSAESGDIVLMHDVHKITADSIGTILKELTENGFQPVTVSELFEFSGIDLENNKVYREIK